MDFKKIYIMLGVFLILSIVAGGTLAWITWTSNSSQDTMVTFTVNKSFSCSVDGGGNITNGTQTLMPTSSCTHADYAIQREILVNPELYTNNIAIKMNLWLNINSISSVFTRSTNVRYALTTVGNSCSIGLVTEGTFNGMVNNDKVLLLDSQIYNETKVERYYLYIWIDSQEEDPAIVNQTIDLSLGGECDDSVKIADVPALPVLDDGMIPVKLSSNGVVTTVDENDDSWYNYDNKEWANVVLVSNSSRSTYKDTTDVPVNQSDILAYYVWIPRYKYKIWTTGKSSVGQERTIEIEFEPKDTEMSLGTQVDEWRTHPAFWWDDNSNGNVDSGEISDGIWVGKFETSGSTYDPRILPNVNAFRNINLSGQIVASRQFSSSGNIYGLSYDTTNAHMMKNSEWGAVAYLSHSKYGINGEIRINNNWDCKTGCGALNANSSYNGECEIPYNSEYTPQSTTGNISGIFDMSGGAYEYVMGNLDNIVNGAGLSSFPASKYYDLYTINDSLTACNGGICYGHALSETESWYNDTFSIVYSGAPWFVRGGYAGDTTTAGIFSAFGSYGSAHSRDSFRSAIVVGYGP